jgi:hypothetical protein
MGIDIPDTMLRRHPELAPVGEALQQFRQGVTTTAQCITCSDVLEVVEVKETGALLVSCPRGHVSFRARRDPSP